VRTGRTPQYDYSGVDLAAPLWTRQHVGKYIGRGYTIVKEVLATPGCPGPVGLFGDTWLPAEFIGWWTGLRPEKPAKPARAARAARPVAGDPLLAGAALRTETTNTTAPKMSGQAAGPAGNPLLAGANLRTRSARSSA
jgi:hypothetical protein